MSSDSLILPLVSRRTKRASLGFSIVRFTLARFAVFLALSPTILKVEAGIGHRPASQEELSVCTLSLVSALISTLPISTLSLVLVSTLSLITLVLLLVPSTALPEPAALVALLIALPLLTLVLPLVILLSALTIAVLVSLVVAHVNFPLVEDLQNKVTHP